MAQLRINAIQSEDSTIEPSLDSSVVKVVLVGPGGVGKTCIASRLATGEFIESEMTVGLNIESWRIRDEGTERSFKIISMDLGGQKQFRFFQEALVGGASVALIVCDLTRYESLLELEEWMDLIQEVPSERRILIGNKADLEVAISKDEFEMSAQKWGMRSILVSTKTGENFDNLEEHLIDILSYTLN